MNDVPVAHLSQLMTMDPLYAHRIRQIYDDWLGWSQVRYGCTNLLRIKCGC